MLLSDWLFAAADGGVAPCHIDGFGVLSLTAVGCPGTSDGDMLPGLIVDWSRRRRLEHPHQRVLDRERSASTAREAVLAVPETPQAAAEDAKRHLRRGGYKFSHPGRQGPASTGGRGARGAAASRSAKLDQRYAKRHPSPPRHIGCLHADPLPPEGDAHMEHRPSKTPRPARQLPLFPDVLLPPSGVVPGVAEWCRAVTGETRLGVWVLLVVKAVRKRYRNPLTAEKAAAEASSQNSRCHGGRTVQRLGGVDVVDSRAIGSRGLCFLGDQAR